MLDFLKSVPDMTNTPEITMHEDTKPKVPMAKRIRAYKKENPSATHKEIATALGSSYQYVYMVLKVKPTPKKKVVKQKSEKPASKAEETVSKEDLVDDLSLMLLEAQSTRLQELTVIIQYLEDKIDELNELKYS